MVSARHLQVTDRYSHVESSCVLEIGIFTSHLVWLARTRRIRKDAAAEGKTFDDILAEYEERGVPFKFAERKGLFGGRRWRGEKGDEGVGESQESPA